MTRAQLINDLKQLIGPAGKGSEVQDPALGVWLNDAYDIIVATITDSIPDFFTKQANASSVAGQDLYALPSDFQKAVMVSISYDGTNWVRALPLNNIGQALDIQQSATTNFDQSQPFYYIYKDKIGFLPLFNQTISNNIKLWYSYNPELMEEDSDSPDLPRRLTSILKYYAYANYLDQNDEHAAAERMRQRFDVQLMQMVNQLVEQQVDQPRSVEVDNDSQGLYVTDF